MFKLEYLLNWFYLNMINNTIFSFPLLNCAMYSVLQIIKLIEISILVLEYIRKLESKSILYIKLVIKSK